MPSIPVSLQLWSVRDAMRRDFADTMSKLAQYGYRAVELAGYGNLDAAGAKAALDAAGLKVSGMHVGRDRLRNELPAVLAEAKLLGSAHLTCPSWPKEEMTTAEGSARIGEQLAQIGAQVRAAGLSFSFHNHAHELALVNGRPVLDWILEAAEPRHLGCELDLYWVQKGGLSPVEVLRRVGGRARLIHVKDETELGLGPVDLPAALRAVVEIGAAEWLVIEQERYNHDPMESVRLCLEQMKRWGYA